MVMKLPGMDGSDHAELDDTYNSNVQSSIADDTAPIAAYESPIWSAANESMSAQPDYHALTLLLITSNEHNIIGWV
jgi:hypothetical protein